MNMEPLVPALPSTNEYEDAATDNGRMGPRSHTHRRTCILPCAQKRHRLMHDPPTASVNWAADAPNPPSVLPPRRHHWQRAKNTFPMILRASCHCVHVCGVSVKQSRRRTVENSIPSCLHGSKESHCWMDLKCTCVLLYCGIVKWIKFNISLIGMAFYIAGKSGTHFFLNTHCMCVYILSV